MIMVPFDEAGAFDLLAILQIKALNGLKVLPEIHVMEHTLCMALSRSTFENITASEEYRNLADANRKMWEIQEWSMRDLCKASVVDKQNQARYHAKQALQRKFFHGDLTEQKTVRPYEQRDAEADALVEAKREMR